MKTNFWAIIPARAGSKRVPNKNIRLLGGINLVTWSIQVAKKTSQISRIIVSTDSLEISNLALNLGVFVPILRPKELATDESATFNVVDHMTQFCTEEFGELPDAVITLPPTSPFRHPTQLAEAISIFSENPRSNSLISCQKIPQNYHQPKLMITSNSGELDPVEGNDWGLNYKPTKNLLARNGPSICITRYPFIEKQLYQKPAIPYIMDDLYSLDINTEWDFLLAQSLLNTSSELKNLHNILDLNKLGNV